MLIGKFDAKLLPQLGKEITVTLKCLHWYMVCIVTLDRYHWLLGPAIHVLPLPVSSISIAEARSRKHPHFRAPCRSVWHGRECPLETSALSHWGLPEDLCQSPYQGSCSRISQLENLQAIKFNSSRALIMSLANNSLWYLFVLEKFNSWWTCYATIRSSLANKIQG